MGVKTRRVFVRVTEEQHDRMTGAARSYGIPLSRLVLLAVEAYVRVCDGTADADLVAVNYGAWARVDRDLSGIESALREAAQQIVGVRWILSAGLRKGALSRDDHDVAMATLASLREDVSRMREDVARCLELIDRVCDMAHLTDPYLGPMEGRAPGGRALGGEPAPGLPE